MIRKYRYGNPFPTEATVVSYEETKSEPHFFARKEENGEQVFSYTMGKKDCVFGLGEQVRGINKRGWIYESYNADDPVIIESRSSLYGSHNFIVVSGEKTFGVFFDSADKVTFDIGYTDPDELVVTAHDVDVYIIEGKSILNIVHQFRVLIGRSYIPPKWAFGYGQSRWGYMNEADIRAVYDGFAENDMPLDMIYMDIDYMQDYKDFSVNKERFPDLPALASDLKEKGVYLVPIIDAAIKVEKGYSVYEEGIKGKYFCTDKKGKPYTVAVWPGESHLPDVLNPEARHWFGTQYKALLDQGIEGFWNDMNEPAIFYSTGRLAKAIDYVASVKGQNLDTHAFNKVTNAIYSLPNSPEDYAALHHNVDGKRVSHATVHNLYGYNMTRGAAEYFSEYNPDRRYLLFSRSSYIGAHRYGGIWTGDNGSWWSHLRLNIAQQPALDMCGFLFTGADVGGHGWNTTEELMLRWFAFGIFTPLMRNHASNGTREQECYRFKDKEAFKNILGIRYSLLPYLYSEYVRCALKGEMLFKPLCFEYTEDERTRTIEDQLLVGDSIMIAPVCEQNARGRYVYLPERMKLIRMKAGDRYSEQILEKGEYYIPVELDEVVFFLREGKVLPLAKPAKNVKSLDDKHLTWVKFINKRTSFEVCHDDGFMLSVLENSFVRYTVEP